MIKVKAKFLAIFSLFCFTLNFTCSSKILIVGIVGGSGAGKNKLARVIDQSIGGSVTVIKQSHYYKDFSYISPAERENINFDSPNAFDFELLAQHLKVSVN